MTQRLSLASVWFSDMDLRICGLGAIHPGPHQTGNRPFRVGSGDLIGPVGPNQLSTCKIHVAQDTIMPKHITDAGYAKKTLLMIPKKKDITNVGVNINKNVADEAGLVMKTGAGNSPHMDALLAELLAVLAGVRAAGEMGIRPCLNVRCKIFERNFFMFKVLNMN